MWLPLGDASFGVASFDEAVGVVLVAGVSASAVTRNITSDFRVVRGEHVRVFQHVHRTRGHVALDIDERHIEAGTVRGAGFRTGRYDDGRLRIIRLRRRRGRLRCRWATRRAGIASVAPRGGTGALIVRAGAYGESAGKREGDECELRHGSLNYIANRLLGQMDRIARPDSI